MFQRFTKDEIEKFHEEYSRRDWLYNPVSSAVEMWEACKGGLRAPEVWHEVMSLEQRLPQHSRMDRYIALERTNLMEKYRQFGVWDKEKDEWTAVEERTKEEAERSAMCVLLAFDMRLGQYYDDKVNPYQPIIDRICRLAANSDFPVMVWNLATAYCDEEDTEETYGGQAPEMDVLAHRKTHLLSSADRAIRDKMLPVVQYFATKLAGNVSMGHGFTYQSMSAVWDDILDNEDILRQLALASGRIRNTIGEHDANAPEAVKGSQYNLKLVLNVIGIMIERKVIRERINNVSKLFFDDVKDTHFKSATYADFSGGRSGLKDKDMLDAVYAIIEQHRKRA